MNLPAEHQTVMPYLILKGAAQFIEFTKNVFGASETHTKRCAKTAVLCMPKLL